MRETLRRAGAALARASCRHAKAATTLLSFISDEERPAGARALAEGVVLGAYRFGQFKDADPDVDRLAEVTIVGRGGQKLRRCCRTRRADRGRRCAWREIWSTHRAAR